MKHWQSQWHTQLHVHSVPPRRPLGIVSTVGEFYAVSATMGLLSEDVSEWGRFRTACRLLAAVEAVRIQDEVVTQDSGDSMDPVGVRLLACLFMLGDLGGATFYLTEVLPPTWTHKFAVHELRDFTFDELNLVHDPAMRGPVIGHRLPYSYDLCGLDPMLLHMIARATGAKIEFPESPELSAFDSYEPLVVRGDDEVAVRTCLEWMCADRLLDAESQRAWIVRSPVPCLDVPVEILAVMRARQMLGQKRIQVDHPILAPPFDSPPDDIIPYTDDLLSEMVSWLSDNYPTLSENLFPAS